MFDPSLPVGWMLIHAKSRTYLTLGRYNRGMNCWSVRWETTLCSHPLPVEDALVFRNWHGVALPVEDRRLRAHETTPGIW